MDINPSKIKAYFDLINSAYAAYIIATPVLAWVLRKVGWSSTKPVAIKLAFDQRLHRTRRWQPAHPQATDTRNTTLSALSLGITGGTLGFFVSSVFGIVGILEFGGRLFLELTQGVSVFGTGNSKLYTSYTVLGILAVLVTMLAFGGKNKAKAVSFVLGTMMGSVAGGLTVLLVALSFLGH